MSGVALSWDEAVLAVEVALITLISANTIAAASVLILVCKDNRWEGRKNLSRELRLPFYLAIVIVISQILFILGEVIQLGSVSSNGSRPCAATSELGWWGRYYLADSIDQSNMVPDGCTDSPDLRNCGRCYFQGMAS